ncbi:CAP domain-containing protein [Deinococcus deserti]|uniref:SCP domain-containing protein n=1 Tax=Deinococcus deserti (strain DSM 17065 / CIP 109153 / LMG 22923 / VCD115) TaxID=546414 RepID=C1CW80_DEIDV|nr:CAP domain-containing protein [Deinococcus deserti]ACO46447.1 conserved hypothetical protein, precursor [Deinococcus deserti VCD115]
MKLRGVLGTVMAGAMLLSSPVKAQSTAEATLLSRLNEVRTQGVNCPGNGRRPVAGGLVQSGQHAQAARIQAVHMGSSGSISHTGAGGTTPKIRAASTGVNAVSVTEIIFMGRGVNPEAAMQWWLNSPVHCYWMTEGRYTHAGASIIQGARGTAYVIVLSSQPR